jgi:hypothetical protein
MYSTIRQNDRRLLGIYSFFVYLLCLQSLKIFIVIIKWSYKQSCAPIIKKLLGESTMSVPAVIF